MRQARFAALALLVLPVSASSQDNPVLEVFGGYSYAGGDLAARGWNASIAINFKKWSGFVFDYSGYPGRGSKTTSVGGSETKESVRSSLYGFRFYSRRAPRFTPFAEVLAGKAQIKSRGSGLGFSFVDSKTGFAMAFGGGVDLKLTNKTAWRVAQADYVITTLSGRSGIYLRASSGIVFRF